MTMKKAIAAGFALLCGSALADGFGITLTEVGRKVICEDEEPLNFCFAQNFPDGTIWLGHSLGRHTVTERGVSMISHDNGKTWTEEVGKTRAMRDSRFGMNSFLTRDGLKRSVSGWVLAQTNVSEITVATVAADGQERTEKTRIVLPEPMQLRLHRNVTRLANGKLILTGYTARENPFHCRAYVIESDDDGLNWHFLSWLPDITGATEGPNEGTTVQRKDGTVLAFVRTGSWGWGDPMCTVALTRFDSADGGKTWGKPQKVADYGVDPLAFRLSDGTLALLSGRPGIYLLLDPTGTGDHFERHELYKGPGSSYSTVMETAPGELTFIYDESAFCDKKGESSTNRIVQVNYTYRRIEWTRVICDETPRYIGWPSVAALRSGEVVAVFSGDRDGHVCPFGKVQMVRSLDEGETWSKPVTIADGPIDDRDAGVVEMPDGEIVVFWFTSTAFLTTEDFRITREPRWQAQSAKTTAAEKEAAIGYWRIGSKDGGKTWSKPEKLSNVDQTPHGPILLRNGTLLCMGRHYAGADHVLGGSAGKFARTVLTVSVSKDAGHTWELICKEVPQDPADNPRGFHEPHVAELADGTLVAMARYEGESDGFMRLTFSKDGGRTWSVMKKTALNGHPPHLLPLADGRLLCTYARRVGDRGELACFSSDGGQTWDVENEIVLKKENIWDVGYPSTCILRSGKLLTVYYGREEAFAADGKTLLNNKLGATKWAARAW